jgi:hypothetical protein
VDKTNSIAADIQNAMSACEEELGYIKSILSAVLLLAEKDAHRHALEIVSLSKCAHWVADNLESNADHFLGRAMAATREVEGAMHGLKAEADRG